MTDVNNLTLIDETLEEASLESLDKVHEQGTFTPPLQPGRYRFGMPAQIPGLGANSTVVEPWAIIKPKAEAPAGTPSRIGINFKDAYALTVTGSPGNLRNGEHFRAYISNFPYERKFGGEVFRINDLMYLLKRLGAKAVPKTNAEYIATLAKFGGHEFDCMVTMSWQCSKNRPVFMQQVDPADPTKYQRVEIKEQMGCGTAHYTGGKDKTRVVGLDDDGTYPLEILCSKCGALVRGFSNLALDREVQ